MRKVWWLPFWGDTVYLTIWNGPRIILVILVFTAQCYAIRIATASCLTVCPSVLELYIVDTCGNYTIYFTMRCLRRVAHVRWKAKKSNTEVLQICNIIGIEAFLVTAQLRWTGHVLRMGGNNRLPKAYSELEAGTRSRGG